MQGCRILEKPTVLIYTSRKLLSYPPLPDSSLRCAPLRGVRVRPLERCQSIRPINARSGRRKHHAPPTRVIDESASTNQKSLPGGQWQEKLVRLLWAPLERGRDRKLFFWSLLSLFLNVSSILDVSSHACAVRKPTF